MRDVEGELAVASTRGVIASPGWARVVDAWLDAAVDNEHTRQTYRRAVTGAMRWLEEQYGIREVSEIVPIQLIRWRRHVMDCRAAPRSRAVRVSAFRSFLRWARVIGAHGMDPDHLSESLRTPKAHTIAPMRVLLESEAAALLAAACSPRDRAVMAVMLLAGLRCGEVAGLDRGDLLDDRLRVRQAKGGKPRTVPLHPDLAAILRSHLGCIPQRRTETGEDPMFRLTGNARRITTKAIAAAVAVASRRAFGEDDRPWTPHCLRHTFAVRTLATRRDVFAVSRLLGHVDLRTTVIYLDHLTVGDLAVNLQGLPA